MKTNLKKISQLYTNMTLPVKASMWYLACSVLQKAIGFLTTPIFTRVMGTSDFGVVSMYNSWEAILTVLCTLYLYNGVYNNAMIEYKSDKDGFTSSMQTLSSRNMMSSCWTGTRVAQDTITRSSSSFRSGT